MKRRILSYKKSKSRRKKEKDGRCLVGRLSRKRLLGKSWFCPLSKEFVNWVQKWTQSVLWKAPIPMRGQRVYYWYLWWLLHQIEVFFLYILVTSILRKDKNTEWTKNDGLAIVRLKVSIWLIGMIFKGLW